MIKTRLVGLLSHSKKYIFYHILWQWVALLVQIISVFTVVNFIEHALAMSVDKWLVIKTAVILTIAIFLRYVCDRMSAKASFMVSGDVKRVLRGKIYEKMLRLGSSYREHIKTAEVLHLSTDGVEQLEIYFGRYLPQLLYSLLAPFTLFGVLSFVNFKASLLLLICVPLIPLSIVAVQKFAKRLLKKYLDIYTGLGDSFLENLQGLTTLKIYQADGLKEKEMDEEAAHFRNITMKVLTMQLNSISMMDVVAYGGAAIGMVVVGKEFLMGNVTFGGALIIVLLASEFFIPLRLLGSFFHIAMNGMSASDKIFALLDLPEENKGIYELEDGMFATRLSHVSFAYEKERKVLEDVSLEIPAGSFISIVGESGCGKSTIAALIMGRNKGYEGSILLQEKNLSEIKESSLMEKITLVKHNSYLFKGTVEENLKMGNPAVTKEDMVSVLKKVNLYDFLWSQDGLDTRLMEEGKNFSGGQRQRLAMARALLHDTPMYIFDEATSNIDVESEEMIMKVIKELIGEKTILFISHRLANVVDSHKIYYMESGVMKESGTHQELMRRMGSYEKIYHAQKALEEYGEEVCA